MAKFCGESDEGDVGIVFTAKEWEAVSCLICYSQNNWSNDIPTKKALKYEDEAQRVFDILNPHGLFKHEYRKEE